MSRTAAYPQRGQAVRERRTGAEGTVDAVLNDGTINVVIPGLVFDNLILRANPAMYELIETEQDWDPEPGLAVLNVYTGATGIIETVHDDGSFDVRYTSPGLDPEGISLVGTRAVRAARYRFAPDPGARARDEIQDAITDLATLTRLTSAEDLPTARRLARRLRRIAETVTPPTETEPARNPLTAAPPVPGVTQNIGYTVFAVIRTNHVPGEPADDQWAVAAEDERGATAVWTAYATSDGRKLVFENGSYASPGLDGSARWDALAELARRGGVLTAVDQLSSMPASRAAYTESHARVLDQLTQDVPPPAVRDGLAEAAALGRSTVSRPNRGTWEIRYDRLSCTFSVRRRF
jgi:hypothetical protein